MRRDRHARGVPCVADLVDLKGGQPGDAIEECGVAWRHGTVLEAYRGYGSREEIFLIGRVFRQSPPEEVERDGEWRRALRDIGRRIRRRKVAGASVVARFGGAETRVVTDRDGYFRVALRPRASNPG